MNAYQQELKIKRDNYSAMLSMQQEALEKGLEKGMEKLVLTMLKNGQAPEEIARFTELPLTWIQQLQQKLQN